MAKNDGRQIFFAISVNTKLNTNKPEIANEFNKYFATSVQTIKYQLLIHHTRAI